MPEQSAAARWRRIRRVVAVGVFWGLVLLGAVLLGAGLWLRRSFGVVSVDQVLTNLPGGGREGAGGQDIVTDGVVTAVVVPVLLVAAAVFGTWRLRRLLAARGVPRTPRGGLLLRVAAWVTAVGVFFGGAGFAAATVGARDFIEAYFFTGTSLSKYYVAPEVAGDEAAQQAAQADSARPKNLVLIYLESIEDAMSDDTVFEKNMLQPVERATKGWDSIPNLRQYPGGGWTMSGIVSTQCGIPLRSSGSVTGAEQLNLIGEDGAEVESYLPGAVCLGDVLSAQGYRNVFLGGADAGFAGKGAFLSTHGYERVDDLSTWRKERETEIRDDWGLSDRRLFERAKDEVTRLQRSGEPFNLTMLTLDTHEGPRVFEYCDWDTETAMTAITSCSMQQVAGFVKYMDEQGYLDDTVVVLMGDHQKALAQGGSFWDELRSRENRTIFNRVWSPDGVDFARDDIDQFSVYPTLLELMGVQLPDRRAGVGVSALASAAEAGGGTMLDLDREDYLRLARSRSTDLFTSLWEGTSRGAAPRDSSR